LTYNSLINTLTKVELLGGREPVCLKETGGCCCLCIKNLLMPDKKKLDFRVVTLV